MKTSYYPGCTLKTKAKNLEDSALAAFRALGIPVQEMPSWNCCGAVYSLAKDDLFRHLAPVRVLIRALEQGSDRILTLCSMCYNTLARANRLMRENETKRRRINGFMDEEPDYRGELEVVHPLRLLEDEIGWEELKRCVKNPLHGMRVAPYYGCMLQRPREVGIEPPGSFALMSRLIESLGATAVKFPAAHMCCGSYQAVGNPEAAKRASSEILNLAAVSGAEAMALSCPLCEYNIGKKQSTLLEEGKINRAVPTFYFTQLIVLALGIAEDGNALKQPTG
jgi:heterodisulfide reductase subunit B